jgi:hypothetical protein
VIILRLSSSYYQLIISKCLFKTHLGVIKFTFFNLGVRKQKNLRNHCYQVTYKKLDSGLNRRPRDLRINQTLYFLRFKKSQTKSVVTKEQFVDKQDFKLNLCMGFFWIGGSNKFVFCFPGMARGPKQGLSEDSPSKL